MSGASGKVPAAIHISPEAKCGGLLAKVRSGDVIRFDADAGVVEVDLSAEELGAREIAEEPTVTQNLGRSLYGGMRSLVSSSQKGATVFDFDADF